MAEIERASVGAHSLEARASASQTRPSVPEQDHLPAARHGGEVDLTHAPIEHEKPEDWGWHADFGTLGRIAGWVCVLVLLVGVSATHYNNSGTGALLITAGLLVVGLLWDARRRRTSWRR